MRFVLCAVVCLAVACASEDERRADPQVERMQAELTQLRNALQERPGTPLLEFQIGQVFDQYGLVDSARAAYERSVELYEAFPEAHLQLAQIYYESGLLEKSVRAYEQVVRFDIENAAAYNNLGYVHKKLGDLDKAAAAYEQAIAADSAFVQAYNNLGQLYKDQERDEEAIALLRRAIAIRGDFAEAYINLGGLYQIRGDIEAETLVWRKFLEQFGEQQEYSAHAQDRLLALGEPAQGADN